MITANRTIRAGLTARPTNRHEMGWLLAVAAAFLVVHIVAVMIWGRASASESTPPAQATISPLYD